MAYLDRMRRFAVHASPKMSFRFLPVKPGFGTQDERCGLRERKMDRVCPLESKRFSTPVPLLPIVFRTAEDQEALEGKSGASIDSRQILRIIDYALDKGRHPVIGYSYYALQSRAPSDTDRFADHSSLSSRPKKIGKSVPVPDRG